MIGADELALVRPPERIGSNLVLSRSLQSSPALPVLFNSLKYSLTLFNAPQYPPTLPSTLNYSPVFSSSNTLQYSPTPPVPSSHLSHRSCCCCGCGCVVGCSREQLLEVFLQIGRFQVVLRCNRCLDLRLQFAHLPDNHSHKTPPQKQAPERQSCLVWLVQP
jgi:hypothetical protein